MSFSDLPTELYEAIFSYVSSSQLQQTVLAVTRATPLSAIPLRYLFECVRITQPQQAVLLYRRLRQQNPSRSNSGHAGCWVREFSVETWVVDADIIVNLISFLPNLRSLSLWVGPNNFAPEHLEELFVRPILGLRYLALRFRPYVEKATYYQFLKGAYFDSTLVALSRWPTANLTTISIVQDPLDPTKVTNKGFAQPLVFFRLDLAVLLKSPAISASLTSLRIRIPLRPVARSLCNAATPSSTNDLTEVLTLPNLEFMDLSTCGVLDSELDMVLVRFVALKHLVLDDCPLLRGDLREGEPNALGKRCALAGVRRAKEREKTLKAFLESRALSNPIGGDDNPAFHPAARRAGPKKGRKGLSTATISFRDPAPVAGPSVAQTSLVDRFTQSMSISSRPPGPNSSSSSSEPRPRTAQVDKSPKSPRSAQPSKRPGAQKIRVLPCLPILASLSIKLSAAIQSERIPSIRAEFEEGWAEGIAQLTVTRARLRTSAGNGFRVMRITAKVLSDGSDEDEDESEDGFEDRLFGLEDVDRRDPEAFGMGNEEDMKPPILCFTGPGRDGSHEDSCSHSIGWDVMNDEM